MPKTPVTEHTAEQGAHNGSWELQHTVLFSILQSSKSVC